MKNEAKKEFLENPQAWASRLIQTTLIKSGFPVSKVAEAIGKSDDLIYKIANPNCDTQNAQLWASAMIMLLTQDFTILREQAAMFGFALIPVSGDPVAAFKELAGEIEAGKRGRGEAGK